MKTIEIIKRARELAKPFRVNKGKDFRLKDVDPDATLEFTKEADKPRAKEALATGVAALAELQDKLYAQDKWAVRAGKLEFNSFLHFEQQHDVLNETLSVVMKLHLHDYV